MNQYGVMARDHWARWLPGRYAQIPDPGSFFTDLGEEVAQEIGDLTLDLAGSDPAGEDYLAKVRRLNMARLQARENVLAERVLLEPEPGTAGTDQEDRQNSGQPGATPMSVGPDHPLWEQINAEQQERLQGG